MIDNRFMSTNHSGKHLRLVRDRPRFTDTLESVKFVCKDVWIAVWEKQVDNLRTNHRVSSKLPPGIFIHAIKGCLCTSRQLL